MLKYCTCTRYPRPLSGTIVHGKRGPFIVVHNLVPTKTFVCNGYLVRKPAADFVAQIFGVHRYDRITGDVVRQSWLLE